jgi:hypothetical protein
MNSIHSLQNGQACAFDFIQNVLSTLSTCMEQKAKSTLFQKEEQEVAAYYEKANKKALAEANARKEAIARQNNQQMEQASKAENDSKKFKDKKGKISLPEAPPVVTRHVPVMPEKKWTELPEYRTAYLQALNEGLAGQDARDRTRGLLVNVLAEVQYGI